ncbi:MAG: potassium transporter TrkG, partial [Bacteroidota bacterium]
MINFSPISNVIGILLIIIGGLMLTGIPFSLYFDSGDGLSLFFAGGITILAGLLFRLVRFKTGDQVNKREGYLIVALGWLAMVTFGSLPYLISGAIPSPVDALFETVSGMTTTGASILNDIEAVPAGILYWRSLTQWIGGMGIIVLTVAILPLLGIGGIELFVAEAPGPTSDKIHPRIQETAKRLWLIYVGLTVLLTGILYLVGMSFYEAINHALTTMATGGFSTRNGSMADFNDPLIQYPIILFMFIAGINYTVIYWSLTGKFKQAWRSDELRAYLLIVGVLTFFVTLGVLRHTDWAFEESFRASLFQIVSLITTTGFVSADYTSWGTSLTMVFFCLL